MVEHARVVVIGGGAVGVSALYHLAKFGWTEALLLERDELTSGSTWHAAGNCPTYSTNWAALKLQKYSAELYRGLAAAVDYPINYHVVGAIRLAHTVERMDEFAHVRAMARQNGMDYEILSPSEIQARHPFVTLDDLAGALWDPYDGDIDPAQLTQALAKGARDLGATIRRFTKVTSLAQKPDGGWRIGTHDGGVIEAEVVVNAAGYRAGEIMALLGRSLPIVALSHQYLVTEDLPEILALPERLPLMRDPDVSYYLRQERGGFILGPYEWQATPMWLDGLPEDFSFKLWNQDLDRLESIVEAAMGRVPPLASAGIRRVVNGPIPYSPDGNPYIGPERGLRNFFHANTFSFGITQAGGAGKALAEWVIHGGPEWDLWSFDRRRYTAYADQAYTVAKAVEIYQNEYAPAFPQEERAAGRKMKVSPLYDRLAAKGARFGARAGFERPVYFDPGRQVAIPTLSFRRAKAWDGLVAAEVAAVRERVGLLDFPGFAKYVLSGPGAEAHLDGLLCTKLPRLGRLTLAYALTPRGSILSEFTVTRLASDHFWLIGAGSAEWHDLDLLETDLPADGSVRLDNFTETHGSLVLAGPRAREVLGRLTEADLSNAAFPWLSAQRIAVAGVEVLALRVNYVGELGWELHAEQAALPGLYDALVEAGADFDLADFGLYAMDSLRLDKGYRGWKVDIETGYNPDEAGLSRFVAADKPDFVGKAALLAARKAGIAQHFVSLTLEEAGETDALPLAPVFPAEAAGAEEMAHVGLVTSAGWSFTLGKSIALAYVAREWASPGTRVAVEILGRRVEARVGPDCLYDPDNLRPRA